MPIKIILISLLLPTFIFAGLTRFTLKDGSILSGIILTQTDVIITAEIDFNKVTIQKSDILSLENIPDQDITLYLKSGSKISGKFVFQDMEKIRVSLSELGEITVLRTNLIKIQWKDEIISTDSQLSVLSNKTMKEDNSLRNHSLIAFDQQPLRKATSSNKAPDITPSSIKNRNISFQQPYHWKAAAKSSILPSWGQFSKGEKSKGVFIACAEGFLLSTTAFLYYKSNNIYDNSMNIDSNSIWYMSSRISGILTISFHLFNMIDALVTDSDITSDSYKKDISQNTIFLFTRPF